MDKRPSQNREGFIYLMRSEDPQLINRVKIGLSENPPERRKQLSNTSVAYPFFLVAVWAVSDMKLAEQSLHAFFKAYRVTPNREFFHVIAPQLHEEILGYSGPATPDDQESCFNSFVDQMNEILHFYGIVRVYDVGFDELADYSKQLKITKKNPDNPEAYGPLFNYPGVAC